MTVLYDNLAINREILLDLPFREGRGIITQDVAKPHHPITLVNTPTWAALDSGKMTLDFDYASSEYLQCLAASSADLDFTDKDYSIGGWVNWSGTSSYMILARYELYVSGWELYFYNAILSLRHSHAAGATTSTSAFSLGWTANTWWFFVLSRSGGVATMYRNDEDALTVTHSAGGLIDPETCNRDLVSCRFTKDSDFFNGPYGRLWVRGRATTNEERLARYEHEKRWFA